VQLIPAHLHPASATSLAPDVSFPELALRSPLRGGYNRLTHALAAHGLWQMLRGPFNSARQTVLGLPPLSPIEQWRRVRRDAGLVLYGYSAFVAPRPADWDERMRVTGYWFLEHGPNWQPPAALVEFLAAGPPPVYVGFGSVLAGSDPDALTALVIAALRETGQRGVLFRGWGDFARGDLPPDMIAVDSVPHDWLFPQMAVVATHGGAGTVAYALRAGVPVVVMPVYGDQPFWGRRVAALGAGPPPLPRRSLTVASLAHAIGRACADPGLRRRAARVGAHLAAEHGAEAAAGLLERYYGPPGWR
jgi:UDP:flavonoid glycosyltransferase YjiC (YdhE family)